jgi:hypothetical protein
VAPLARRAPLALPPGRSAGRLLARGRASRRAARGGDGIQAPRPSRVVAAAGAGAAYGAVVADTLVRAGSIRTALAPGAGAGAFLLLLALVFGVRTIGPAIWLAGATYVGFLVANHGSVDERGPFVAALLLLSAELAAWSLDERRRLRSDWQLQCRRAGAIAALTLGGLGIAALVLSLGAAPPSSGLAWTVAGAIAAVGAAGGGIWLARR